MSLNFSLFLSVFQKPTVSSEVITFRFSQFNVIESQFDVSVTVTDAMSEYAIAQTINDAMIAGYISNNCAYTGLPNFSRDGYPPFTLRNVMSDQCINIWSQVGFKITINPTGGGPSTPGTPPTTLLSITSNPIFMTYEEATILASNYGVALIDMNGVALDPAAVMSLMQSASARIISYMNGFPISLATYMQEVRGNYKLGCQLDRYPILPGGEDRPVVRGPYFSIMTSQSDIAPIVNYDIDYEDGIISFPNYGSYQRMPLDINNVMKMSYPAGYPNIPQIVKDETVRICNYVKYNAAIAELKEGAFTIKYTDPFKFRLEIQTTLNQGLGR